MWAWKHLFNCHTEISRNLHGSSTRKKVSLFNCSFMLGIFIQRKSMRDREVCQKRLWKLTGLFLENLVHFWPEVIQNASVRSQFSVNSKAAFAMETASTLQKMPKYYTLHGNTCTFYWNCFIRCVSWGHGWNL